MDNILNCAKCGEYPQINTYRDGDGYSALICCQCSSIKRHGDIVRWAMDRAVEDWNEQNGGKQNDT